MRRAAAALLCLGLAACGATFRPFAARPVIWRDADARPFAPKPAELYTGWAWDGVDNTMFRQVSRVLRYERSEESVDVNALDEVPDSSWFTNRLSLSPRSLDALADGACAGSTPPRPPFVVVRGKTAGTSPGAVVRAGDGRTYVIKVDFDEPERATAADAISTRFVHAAGYATPCNVVAYLRPEDFRVAPNAPRSSIGHARYSTEDLHELFEAADDGPGGTKRVSLSRWLDGEPLGGFRFDGLRDDDPNDVVPHEDRRELRGFYVLSAWMNHIDARAENNLDEWVSVGGGRGWVRHVILDAGDSFGIVWGGDVDSGMARRLGSAHYLDFEQVSGDMLTLGLVPRAYRDARRGPAFAFLGWYDVERFDPGDWRPGYPNAAFERRTEADCAWMARIVARFGEPEIRAVVSSGKITNALWESELVRILMGRRARVLERYLVRLSPLSSPEVDGRRLCMRDVAVDAQLRTASMRAYRATRWEGLPPRAAGAVPLEASDGRVCAALPEAPGGSWRYHIVDIVASTPGRETSGPARVHLWSTPAGAYVVAGLERPNGEGAP